MAEQTEQEIKEISAEEVQVVELSPERLQAFNEQLKMTPSEFNKMVSSYYSRNKVVPIHKVDNKKRKQKRRAQKAARRNNR